MKLIIDIGNSAAKIATMADGNIIRQWCVKDIDKKLLDEIFNSINNHKTIQSAILSSTRIPDKELITTLSDRCSTLIFDHTTPIPIKNCYLTPKTLGPDRLAAAIGVWSLAPNKDSLIIDLGTAITIDRLTTNGEYLGGNISPGMAMRFQALTQLTDRLPLCEPIADIPTFGQTTTQAIQSGVIRGIIHEIQGYIDQTKVEKIFFTGRDAIFFAEQLKITIFADCDLVAKGLYTILEHNEQKINY